MNMVIRPALPSDNDVIWRIFHEVVAPGDTYAIDPAIGREEALRYWFGKDTQTYVLEKEESVLGTYIIRPNHAGAGAHVANAAYMVTGSARGAGLGRAMGEHSLGEARRLGFRAVQFNFVLSTNDSAIRLWQGLGFRIVGMLPGAFRHPKNGFVDAYVMFRSLEQP